MIRRAMVTLTVVACAASSTSCEGAPPKVLAVSGSNLYAIDVSSGELTPVGAFVFAYDGTPVDMNDIALAPNGELYAGGDSLFRCDPTTAPPSCTQLPASSNPSDSEYGFPYVASAPKGVFDPADDVLLVYGYRSLEGTIDPHTSPPRFTAVGNLPYSGPDAENPSRNSWDFGDMAVLEDTIFMTARRDAGESHIFAIDPKSWTLRYVGPIGARNVVGLATNGNALHDFGALYGFSTDGTMLRIDPATGAGTPVKLTPPLPATEQWTGAQ